MGTVFACAAGIGERQSLQQSHAPARFALFGLLSLVACGSSGSTPPSGAPPSVAPTPVAAARVLDIADFAAADGFIIQGDEINDSLGRSVSNAGDVNNDGIDDLIIGAWGNDAGGTNAGAAYVIWGKAGATRANLDPSEFTASDGFIVQGGAAGDLLGWLVSAAGDVNNDGYADLIIGASESGGVGGTKSGAAYVIWGKAGTVRSDINAANFDAKDGFIIWGAAANDELGTSVAAAGDVNGDGIADLIVGAPYSDDGGRTNSGVAYVIWGKTGAVRGNIDTSDLGDNGFIIRGRKVNNELGISVSAAGDVNGDGIADLIVGAPNSLYGEAYVIWGKKEAMRDDIETSNLAIDDGFVIWGDAADDGLGALVSATGDINNDGYDDLIIGARYGDNGGENAGEAYVIWGKPGATRIGIDTTNFSSADGFIIRGDTKYDWLGRSVAAAGDINNDGYADLIVGANGGNNGGENAGEAYVIWGKAGATRANIDVTNLTDNDGFIIQGDAAFDRFGWAVSAAGDVNKDGYADLIVGTPFGNNGGEQAGKAYVIYGKSDDFGAVVKVRADNIADVRRTLNTENLAATEGFIVQGDIVGDWLGVSVSAAGDVNNDGYADLIVGVGYGESSGTEAGDAYVIWGKPGATRPNLDTSKFSVSDGFVIQGGTESDFVGWGVSGAGDVNNDGYDDLIIGAPFVDDGGDNAGVAYVVWGKAGAGRTNINANDFLASDGFVIQGGAANDQFGISVSAAGDVNNDGYDDLIVGANGGNNGGDTAGKAYVIWGKTGVTRANIDTENLATSDGFVIQGENEGDRLGYSVSAAGDINKDGYSDLVVGAAYRDAVETDVGTAYVIWGRAGATRSPIDTENLATTDGFIISGDEKDDALGYSVSGAGDVNNDGYDDLIVGANGGSNGVGTAGKAYVIWGKAGATRTNIDAGALTATDGFTIRGDAEHDRFGYSVSAAGDLDSDGYDDLVVGAIYGNDGGENAGEAYVIWGKAGAKRADIDTSSLAVSDGFIIRGHADFDNLGYAVSAAGDINNDGYDDLIVSANLGDDGGTDAGEAYVIWGGMHLRNATLAKDPDAGYQSIRVFDAALETADDAFDLSDPFIDGKGVDSYAEYVLSDSEELYFAGLDTAYVFDGG